MKSQVWVSTIIYILIGLTIISTLIIAAKPKIDEARDRFVINYMINVMNSLDSTIYEVNDVIGTKRSFEIKINKGELKIIPERNQIIYTITTNFEFSQPGTLINIGKINLITNKTRGKIETMLWITYSEPINITTSPNEEGKNISLTQSTTPYTLFIENLGPPSTDNPNNTIYISLL
ncbi:MAG: hypothetical protein QXQ30_02320 [Candidatus Pacearchaeota archaeon]